MDRGKLLMYVGLGCYCLAMLFLWIATSGISSGWYSASTQPENRPGTIYYYEYGTLRYELSAVTGNLTTTETCGYKDNNRTEASLCEDIGMLDPTGEFVLADTILCWLFLLPTVGCLAFFVFFRPLVVMVKLIWGFGATAFFWSIWNWIVFAIRFSGVPNASPSWAWTLSFIAFLLCTAGLALSVFGVRSGSVAYEVMGAEVANHSALVAHDADRTGDDPEEFSHQI